MTVEFPQDEQEQENNSHPFEQFIDTGGQDLRAYLDSKMNMYGFSMVDDGRDIDVYVSLFIYESIRQRSPDPNKLTVYYPGIGGGDQTFDLLSPFHVVQADEVYGVDLLGVSDDFDKAVEMAENDKWTCPGHSKIEKSQDADHWQVDFEWKDKPRRVKISKKPTSVSVRRDDPGFVPEDPDLGVIVYSRGTETLVNRMPQETKSRVKALYVSDPDPGQPKRVMEHWTKEQGMLNLDMRAVSRHLSEEYGFEGEHDRYHAKLLLAPFE